MIDNFDLKECKPILATSIPSIITFPLSTSTILYSAIVKDDLPAPVLPQTPTFSPPLISKLTPFKTKSRLGLYLAETFWKESDPLEGHDASGSVALISEGASGFNSIYSCTRSTETMLVSTSVALRTIQLRV